MSRLFMTLILLLFAGPVAAQTADRTGLLEAAQAFGTLVGQAAQCEVAAEAIQAYVERALPDRLPVTGDAAFDEQMNQAFEQAMRSAATPESGCDQVRAAVTGG
ncbi:MAG: hypothetical protein ACE363_08330 [Alphaproteobacteria bacterium]